MGENDNGLEEPIELESEPESGPGGWHDIGCLTLLAIVAICVTAYKLARLWLG